MIITKKQSFSFNFKKSDPFSQFLCFLDELAGIKLSCVRLVYLPIVADQHGHLLNDKKFVIKSVAMASFLLPTCLLKGRLWGNFGAI